MTYYSTKIGMPTPKVRKPLKKIVWTQKLGDLRNDVRVPHWNAIIRAAGMKVIYDFQDKFCGKTYQKQCRYYDEANGKQMRRPVYAGDHYVQFEDDTWDIMDSNTLSWYRRVYNETHKDDADKALDEALLNAWNNED